MELQKRRSVSRVKIAILVFIGVLVSAVVVVFGLFRIRQADVVGNEFYSAEEIQKMVMTGSLAENSLYLTWKYSKEDAADALPFLNAVEVSMVNPYHVQIKVFEKTIAGYMMYSGNRVYFDTDGTVVEISGKEREGIPPYSGIAIGQPVVGEKLPVDDEAFLADIVENCSMLMHSGLVPDEVHYDDNRELIFYFGESRVLLGGASYMEEKIANLHALFPQMEGMSGTLHMEKYTPGTTTISFKIDERGEEESELIMNLGDAAAVDGSAEAGEEGTADVAAETDQEGAAGDQTTDNADTAGVESEAGGSAESQGGFSIGADGSEIYTDPLGNVTSNLDQPYLGEDGQVISDGYGYIDPYTGAYILN